MRRTILLLLGFTAGTYAQLMPQHAEDNPIVLQWNSPLNHLNSELNIESTNPPRPWNCTPTSYYNENAGTTQYQDQTPTKIWAMRMSLPSLPQVVLCTVWTVKINFRWIPKTQGKVDTMHIFMREVNPPYNQFYHSRYLMKLGENVATLVDRKIPAGYHEAQWYPVSSSRPLGQGIYIVAMNTNTSMETRKVTLLK